MENFGNLEIKHKWKVRECFYWYDGPVLFTCEFDHPNQGKMYMIGQAVDHHSYMFATMSKNRCINVENNVTSIRQAMMFPDGPILTYKTPFYLLHSQWGIFKEWEEDIDKWVIITKDDVAKKDWFFQGGFKWWMTPKEKREHREKRYREGRK